MHRSATVLFPFVLAIAFPVSSRAAEEALSPSMQAYQAVSVVREKYGDVVWQRKPASADELHRIIEQLHGSLKMFDEPLTHDLGEGNLYLRYRRFNILVDLVKLYAQLS